MITSVAAIVFAVVTSAFVGFQLAIALGAPWNAYAMGAAFPENDLRKCASQPSCRLCSWSRLSSSCCQEPGSCSLSGGVSTRAVWKVIAVSAVALELNTITPSTGERRLWPRLPA